MGVRINQNVMAMNAYRNLSGVEGSLGKSLEKLSSGFRINRAADDAAGLVISEGLRSQVLGLKMATRNAQDGVSVVQTAEGALTETHAILQRMRELTIQAASTGSADQPSRDAAQLEVAQLTAELDRIASTTMFGQQRLLAGTYGRLNETPPGTSTGSVIDTTVNNKFSIWPDVQHGLVNTQEVTLTSNRVFDANVGGDADAAALEADINAALQATLLPHYPTRASMFRADVKVVGTDPNALFVTTFSANEFDDVMWIRADNGGAGTAADVSALLGVENLFSAVTGSGGAFQIGAGTTSYDTIHVTIGDMTSAGLGVDDLDVSVAADAGATIAALESAIVNVSTLRGNLGAYQNRFERTISNLSVTTENLSASESRIRDTDMGEEMVAFTRASILQQAGTAMLAQANAVPQSVLKLVQQ